MRLQGRRALITGAGSGIGEASALAFACEGARVVVNDLDPERGASVVARIRAQGGQAHFVQADVSERAQCQQLIDAAVAWLGGLDLLYNNAGIAPVGRDGFTAFMAEDDWDWMLRVNLTSVFLCSKYAIPHLQQQPGACILNMASSMASLPFGMTDGYAASKGAVANLTRSMAPSCASLGIRVNALAPGYVDTPLTAVIFGDDDTRDAFSREHATGMQTAEEIAEVAVFITSEAGRSFTGAVLACDRGWTAFKRPARFAM